MRGAHLLACVVLVGVVAETNGQPSLSCPLSCGDNGTCHQSAVSEAYCKCDPGYYGSACENEVCTSLTEAVSFVPICSLSAGGTCKVNLDAGQLCECPPGKAGVLCDQTAPQVPHSLCQKREQLSKLVLTLLNTSAQAEGLTQSVRQVLDLNQLKALLQDMDMTYFPKWTCDTAGMHETVQCEVNIFNLTDQMCYCAVAENGKVMNGHSKMSRRPTNCQTDSPPVCEMAPETGPCRALIRRWFFNSSSSKCEMFTYGGCRGNENNFETVNECYNKCPDTHPCASVSCVVGNECVVVPDDTSCNKGKCGHSAICRAPPVCEMAPETGPCRARIGRWFFNSSSSKCEMFPYGGCRGNENNFETVNECYNKCPDTNPCASVSCVVGNECVVVPDDTSCNKGKCGHSAICREIPDMAPEECKASPKPVGMMCLGNFPRWFYNHINGTCEMYTFGGCKPSTNNFMTAQQCYYYCNNERSPCQDDTCTVDKKCTVMSSRSCQSGECDTWAECKEVVYELTGTAKLAVEWDDQLYDTNSKEYKTITKGIKNALLMKYSSMPNFVDVVITSVNKGSLIVPYTTQYSSELSSDDQARATRISNKIQNEGLENMGIVYAPSDPLVCVIPTEYKGTWFSMVDGAGVNTSVSANQWNDFTCEQIRFESKAWDQKGVNSTLLLKSRNCFKCVKVLYRNQYILQVKEGNCSAVNLGFDMCQQVDQEPFQTFFNKYERSKSCKPAIEGYFQFSYEVLSFGGGVCDNPSNTIVTRRNKMDVSFTQCTGVLASMTSSYTFECMGTWHAMVGNTRYTFAAVADVNNSVPYVEKFRCLMTDMSQMSSNGQRWAMSRLADCRQLQGLYNAPIMLELRKKTAVNKTGKCPADEETDMYCSDSCDMDVSCEGRKKCCNGCCKLPTGSSSLPEKCYLSPLPPPNSPTCMAFIPRWFFNSTTSKCERYIFGGCGRSLNDFDSPKQCYSECPITVPKKCEVSPLSTRVFGCFALIPRWFYNQTTSQCEKYTFNGCDRSTNDFDTPQHCYSACNDARSPCMNKTCAYGTTCRVEEVGGCHQGNCSVVAECRPSYCFQRPETGPCEGYMSKWFHNSTSNMCEKFIYGGCQGNMNKFESSEACYNTCAPRSNQCNGHPCPSDRLCTLKEDKNCTRGACSHYPECRATDKPGQCPVYNPMMQVDVSGGCGPSCDGDHQCEDDLKCCQSPCGKSCHSIQSACGEGRMMCRKAKKCVSNDLICNGQDDCGDNSDEFNCPEKTYKHHDFVKLNMPWSTDLKIPNSYRYKSLKRALETHMERVFIPLGDFKRVVVTGFSRGSVISNITLESTSPITATKRTRIQQTMSDIPGSNITVDGKVYSFISTDIEKPGDCPVVNSTSVGICLQICSSDENCTGTLKCCFNGCGNTCQYPVNTTTDKCMSDLMCANGGTCYNHHCLCKPGFQGKFCAYQKNPCANNPCKNGGSCMMPYHRDNYTCSCPTGIYGQWCEKRVCDLFTADVCQGDYSICKGDIMSGDFCQCQFGLSGVFCEIKSSDTQWGCQKQLAFASFVQKVMYRQAELPLNTSVVAGPMEFFREVNMTFITLPTCSEFPNYYTSPSCDIDVRTREKSCYCVNRLGTEISQTRIPASLGEPDCRDPCEMNPCQNGGKCHAVNGTRNTICTCPDGFSGDKCQRSICSLLPPGICETYGGRCIGNLSDGRLCDCSTVYTPQPMTGVLCDTPGDDTKSTWCQRHYNLSVVAEGFLNGSMTLSGMNGMNLAPILLSALAGSGIQEIVRPHCNADGETTVICRHRVHNMSFYECSCTDSQGAYLTGLRVGVNEMPPYCPVKGETCAIFNCKHNSTCYRHSDRSYCYCPSGYTGKYCEKRVGLACASNPCKNGFACESLYDGGYRCNCSSEWGPDCSNVPSEYCTCNPMQRCVWYMNCSSGSCYTTHKCVGYNYTGPCDRRPCGMNGKCVEQGSREYRCLCDSGFTGVRCSVNTAVCGALGPAAASLCSPGSCVGDIEDGRLCQCPRRRRGAFCEQEGDAPTLCQRQSDLYLAAMEVLNKTRQLPGVQNASDIVRYVTSTVMGLQEIPLVNCTPSGDFTPQQCAINLSSFEPRCYCVNSAGEEIYQNITMLPAQPPCTSPDPNDIAKMLCQNLGESLCLNKGRCVGEMDSTPKLCECPYGYEGILCERKTDSGEQPEEFTMCTFNLGMYNVMKEIMNGTISLTIQNTTMNRNLLISTYMQLAMGNTMTQGPVTMPGMPDNLMEAANSSTGIEMALLKPNCTVDGAYNSLQCEYGLMSEERYACYCFSSRGKMVPGTRTMPPNFPNCDNVTDMCQPLYCPLNCPNGYRRNMLGCEICECKEMCDGRMCRHGTRCKEMNGRSECRKTHKKGMCPKEMMATIDSLMKMFEDTMDTCEMRCRDDADCEGEMKCCGTCGNRCVHPYIPENCEEKRVAMEAHWILHKNLSAMLMDSNITSMANRTFPAVLHSAIAWVHQTKTMWKPSCDDNGDYKRVQCMYNLQTGAADHCFCADMDGRRINGTDRRPPVRPMCKVKPGYCPMTLMTMPPSPDDQFETGCSEDYDCNGHDKCCPMGSSMSCLAPLYDTLEEHNKMIAGMFSQLCGMLDNPCYHGSECISDWNSATMCDCPSGYKGPLCSKMLDEDEEAPTTCERRKAIFEMIMNPEFAKYKTMALHMLQVQTIVLNKANCTEEGFAPTQCDYDINNGSRKWCYCVNETGHPIPGTRVYGDMLPQCGDMKCDVGHSLYRPDRHDAVRCEKHDHCPAGYECKHVAYGQKICCISSEGHKDICNLAASPGKWCDEYTNSWSRRFTFNSTLGKCMPFKFRGCHGNDNTFTSVQECEKRCVKKDKKGTCPPASTGLNGRYCKDSCEDDSKCPENKKCCATGCGRKCVMPKRDDDDRVCKQGLPYTYVNGSNFYCGRGQPDCPDEYTCNVDSLDRASFCCPDEDKPVNVCHQPKQAGPCKSAKPRYFFNRMTNQCERFTYGGCKGNDNNFESLEECCLRCGSDDDQCKPGTCPNPTKNYLVPCGDKCDSDKGCMGNSRCCFTGCGKECILPKMEVKTNCHTMLKKAHMMLRNFEREEICPMMLIPRCNRDGSWQSQQCLDGFGICWCVDSQGNKIENSLRRGHADCPKSMAPLQNIAMNMENDAEFMNFQVCPMDTGIHCCHPSMCQLHTCRAHPSAVCRVNPCNGCQVEFFNKDNEVVNCMDGLSKCELHLHRAKTSHAQNLFNRMPSFTDRIGNFTQRMMDRMIPEPEEPAVIPKMCQVMPDNRKCNEAVQLVWYYNHERNRCEMFESTGCKDNINQFTSVEECYQICNPQADPCKMKECGEGRECHMTVDPDCFNGQCAHWAECRYIHSEPHFSGVNVPKCEKDMYARKQCHHGYCWCVDSDGSPVENSLAMEDGLICQEDGFYRMREDSRLQCKGNRPPNLDCVDTCLGRTCPGNPKAICVVNICSSSCDFKFMDGSKEVKCQSEDTCDIVYAEPPTECTGKSIFCEEGSFPKMCMDKCKDVTCPGNPCAVCTMDKCNCEPVFMDMLTNEPITDCSEVPHTRCEMTHCSRMKEQQMEELMYGSSSVMIPTCTVSGHFEPQQCNEDICFCVDGDYGFLTGSSRDESCRWKEIEEVHFACIFKTPYSLIQGKEGKFIRAVRMALKEHTRVPNAEKYIRIVEVFPGSIGLNVTLGGDGTTNLPPPQVTVMADIIQNKIANKELTVNFEDYVFVADSTEYSRTNRYKQEPHPMTPGPEPEPEPALQRHEVIIIAVVCSIAGVFLLGVIVKCCCCRKDKKDLPVHNSPPEYINTQQFDNTNMAVSNATYGMVKPPIDNLGYSPETEIIKKPIEDNLGEEDFIKVRL